MSTPKEIKRKLEAPFPVEQIHWRIGNTTAKREGVKPWQASKGQPLAYIDARDAMERLDEAVGFGNWQDRYAFADNGLLVCEVGIRIDGEWLWRANGAGDTQVEAEKGKCSDAFKRACVMWGIGRYLYDSPNTWIALENGRIPPAELEKLNKSLTDWQSRHFAQARCEEAARENAASVKSIKQGIANQEWAKVAEAWEELDDTAKMDLWLAPTKGGVFTTQERSAIKSDEVFQHRQQTEEAA